jgi:hypothetical protein
MKKSYFFATILFVPSLLFGCSQNPGASETEKELDLVYRKNISAAPVKYQSPNKEKLIDFSLEEALPLLKKTENNAVSPITLAMALTAYGLSSGNSDALLSSSGISSLSEFYSLVSSLNWDGKSPYEDSDGNRFVGSKMRSCAFYQISQSGEHISYQEGKREEYAGYGLPTLVSEPENTDSDAEQVIKEFLGKELPLPAMDKADPMVRIYSALTVKEYRKLGSEKAVFHGAKQDAETDFTSLTDDVHTYKYYKGSNYQYLSVPVQYTDLTFILPDEGVSLSSLSPEEAYKEGRENAELTPIHSSSVPFFTLDNEVDAGAAAMALLQGTDPLSGLVESDVPLNQLACKQKNRFVLDKNGIEGDSVTVMQISSSPAPMESEIDFVADRPFYAFSTYDDLPLFAMTVVDL